MVQESIKLFYNTVLSQTISSCGDYLFTGNNFGEIIVFNISQICAGPDQDASTSSETRNTSTKPIQIFKVSDASQVFSLAFHKNFVIAGTTAKVTGYSWSKNELSKKTWEVKLPANKEQLEQAEVNSLWLDKINGHIYAGCGDHMVYAISLEDGQVLREFSGHKDYIHSVHGSDNRLFSASEDGTVKFWDYREKRSTGQIEPHKHDQLNRPNFGKWQGTVSVTDDWLICGGGPKFSLWHLRSLECTTVYPFSSQAHVSGFLDDIIFVAGDHSYLYQYTFGGDVTAEVPVSAASVYSVVWQLEPTKIMSIGGSSNSLDICTDFNYKDIVLNLYKSHKKYK